MDFLILIFFLMVLLLLRERAGSGLIQRLMPRGCRQTGTQWECGKVLEGEGGDGRLQNRVLPHLDIIIEVQLDVLGEVRIPHHGVPLISGGRRLGGERRRLIPGRAAPQTGGLGRRLRRRPVLVLVLRPRFVELVLGVGVEVGAVGDVLDLLEERKLGKV